MYVTRLGQKILKLNHDFPKTQSKHINKVSNESLQQVTFDYCLDLKNT